MPRPDKEVAPFYKVTGILSNENAEVLRRESITTLDEFKRNNPDKRVVRINEYTWVEVDNAVSDEEAKKRFFRKRKALKEFY